MSSRTRIGAFVAYLALTLVSGCHTAPVEGRFLCDDASDCPTDWSCRADHFCWRTPDQAPQCMAGMHFVASVMGCRPDLVAPTIHIDPMTPHTLDDLAVVIDAPTVDARPGAGPVTYAYAWSRDGATIASEASATVAASATAHGETWSVVVTPMTDEGLAGPTATAMVTVANTAPSLRTVGLSTYGPIVGETLQMIPGPTADDDGDTVSFEFEWQADGTTIAGSATAFLTSFTADQHILGRARATDGTDVSDWVQVGPVTTLADVTRWRALLPQREIGAEGFVEYDEPNDRLVIYAPANRAMIAPHVWEYPMHGDGRFVQLFPTGTPALRDVAAHAVDATNHRVLVFAGADRSVGAGDTPPTNSLFALDLTRGAERWLELHPTGTLPPSGFASTLVADDQSQRLFAMSGVSAAGVSQNLYELDVAVAGAEHWSLVGTFDEAFIRPAFVRDPARARWVVLGASASGPVAYGIADSTRSLTRVSAVLTGLTVGPLVLPRGDDMTVELAYGARPDGSYSDSILTLDLATLTFMAAEWTGDAPPGSGGTGSAAALGGGRFLVWPGASEGQDRGPLTLFEANVTSRSWTLLHDDGAVGPPASESAVALSFGKLTGGLTSAHVVDEGIWTFAGSTWSLHAAPTGFSPRYDWGRYDPTSVRDVIWGGLDASGALVDTHIWDFFDQSDQGDAPGARATHGAAVLGSCGGRVALAGGLDASEQVLDTTQALVCSAGGCNWSDLAALPMPLGWAVGSSDNPGSTAFIFGGWTGASASASFQTMNCVSGNWTPISFATATPSARLGHAITAIGSGSSRTDWIVVGGLATPTTPLTGFDAWQLHRSGAAWSWIPLAPEGDPPAPRGMHTVWAEGSTRVFVIGGRGDQADRLSDMWELRLRP